MADPDQILVCLRIADLPEPPVKSRESVCARCRASVWVAFSSPQVSTVWCWQCAAAAVKDNDEVAPPTEAQWQELEEYWDRRRER
jgi:hypothetical protein